MTTTPILSRPLPKGVTQPDAVLSDLSLHRILTGQLIPNANAIHALAKEVTRYREGNKLNIDINVS